MRVESRIAVRLTLASAARWLWPSVVAVCAGAIAAGLVEGGWHSPHRVVATIGFVALYAVPWSIVASVIVRGLVHAWQPRRVLDGLVEPDGSAPRLAGWAAVIWLAALGILWAMFQGTWWLYSLTAFKPLSVGFLAPMLAVATLLVIVVLSRPAARLFAWLARQIDRPWRRFVPASRFVPATVLRPRIILGGAIVATFVVGWLVWALLVSRRLKDTNFGVVWAPAAGIGAVIAVHLAWRARRVHVIAGALAVAATIAAAVVATTAGPKLTLAIWAAEPIARRGIEQRFTLEDIRSDLPIDEFRLPERGTHPDLVIITFDGMRADRTPPYGTPTAMPVMRAIAERGAVFTWAFAPSNTSRRSIPAMLTGVAASRLRGWLDRWMFVLDPRHVTMPERLRAGGYATAVFACCDEWSREARVGWARGIEHVVIDGDGLALARNARQWIAQRTDPRPLLLWLHVADVTNWQRGADPRTDDERLRIYDSALERADAILGEVVAAFAARSPDRAPIMIVTATHGQGLGEHGQPYDETDLFNSNVRVPLVIAGPAIRMTRVTETVSLVDLAATVFELAGFEQPRGTPLDGHSLAQLATGARSGDSSSGIAFTVMIDETRNEPERSAVVRGSWKLVDSGQDYKLYDLRTDAGERYNMFGQRPLIVGELKLLLSTKARAAMEPPF